MLKKASLFLLMISLYSFINAQSAEEGSPFNQYMSADAGVNLMSGTVALTKNLASISVGDVQASFSMNYSGNVTQAVNNRNDVAPTSWLGLGWAMGFARIICDHNGSMARIDDSYYLVTAEGNRYKIFEDSNKKWWIEGLPYWLIEPSIVENVVYGDNKYEIVVGWKITDDSGRKYFYGDFEDKSQLESGNVIKNASQYVLAWPKTFGLIGAYEGGEAYPFPSVWNLQKIEDLKGNYLHYSYQREDEFLKINSWTSHYSYTKECYLKSVESSDGGRVEFELGLKGEGDFKDEYLDKTGKVETVIEKSGDVELDELQKIEKLKDQADAFVDPLERHYLKKIVMYGKDGNVLTNVEFCYGKLFLAPNGINNSEYVKRLLKTVVFTNSKGEILDKETYHYNEKANETSPAKNIPLGMLDSVFGSNCGKIGFGYMYLSPSSESDGALHVQSIPMKKVSSIGYLENGTPYIVGFNSSNALTVYQRSLGKWIAGMMDKSAASKNSLDYDEDASISIGDRGWFVYVNPKNEGKGADYTPFIWNGQKFVAEKTISDNGSRDNIALGSGFVFKASIEGNNWSLNRSHIKLTIPWTVWGKSYEMKDFWEPNDDGVLVPGSENGFAADDGMLDRAAIYVFASTNHVGIYYLDTDGYNNGRLKIYTFNHDKTKLVLTYDKGDLDDDNRYMLNGDFIYGATEYRGPLGHYADAFRWVESGKDRWSHKNWKLHGVQSEPSIQAFGPDYFVVRHDDNDEMTLCRWDGESWSTPIKNANKVSDDDFDFFYEAEWTGESGNGFFLVREPLVKEDKISFSLPVIRRWKIARKKVEVSVWSHTYGGALLQRYDLRDGGLDSTDAIEYVNGKDDERTHLMVGSDWYIEKQSKNAFTWNGFRWNQSSIGLTSDQKNYKSLGGNFFAEEKDGSTYIYFKKSDSFDKKFGFFLVSEKSIVDPVLDKTVKYTYDYHWPDETGSYDFVNNTPIIDSYSVHFPDGIGMQKKVLGKATFSKNWDRDVGKIVEDFTMNNLGYVTNYQKNTYERYDGSADKLGWPSNIYVDRISWTETNSNKAETFQYFEYAPVNGQISSIKTKIQGSIKPYESEKRIVYAAEKYPEMNDAHRLLEEAEVIECNGECGSSCYNIVSAQASRFKDFSGYNVVQDVWSYNNYSGLTFNVVENSACDFDFGVDAQQNSHWEKNTVYTKYENFKAVESVDRLGIKSSAVYENNKDGLLQGNVVNAGAEEIFLLPGVAIDLKKEKTEHQMELNDFTYRVIPLCGNAVDLYNHSGNELCPDETSLNVSANFGRFASSAILVNGANQLSGKVNLSKIRNYVFSAWVQGVNVSSEKVYLFIDNKLEKDWDLKGDGVWQPIEYEFAFANAGDHTFELKTSNGNNMRVQNVLFIPSDASATVSYWDKKWNVPVVTVNDRGIGSYSRLDINGRVIQTFSEDNEGNLIKVSEREYVSSDCRTVPGGSAQLSQLKINGELVTGLKLGTPISRVYPNSTESIAAEWTPQQSDDRVRYRFYKEGHKTGDWISSCCSSTNGLVQALDGSDNWVLQIDVEPFDLENEKDVYTINISKSTVGWVVDGGVLSTGSVPNYVSKTNAHKLYYLDNEGLISANYNGSEWETTLFDSNKLGVKIAKDFLAAGDNGGMPYVVVMPDNDEESVYDEISKTVVHNNNTPLVYKATQSLPSYSNVGDRGEMFDFVRLAVDKKASPYVLFQKTSQSGNHENVGESKTKNGSIESHLLVRTYNTEEKRWQSIGSTMLVDDVRESFEIIPEKVSDYGVKDADIIVDNNGDVFVAYIGKVAKIANELKKENVCSELGTPLEKCQFTTPDFVVVKKLYAERTIDPNLNEKIWAGPTETQVENDPNTLLPDVGGDIMEVSVNGAYEPLINASRVKWAKGKGNLYLSILYKPQKKSSGKMALSVFKLVEKDETLTDDEGVKYKQKTYKLEPILDKSVGTSIYTTSAEEEQRVITYLDASDPFDFVVIDDETHKKDVPYVMFANSYNDKKLTVVRHDGTRWLSVGSPAFAETTKKSDAARLAVNDKIVPSVVFKEDGNSSLRARRGKIVPMKYSSSGDKDLTLSSVGNPAGTTIGSEFRQYVLNYEAVVPESQSSVDLNLVPKTKQDVCAIVIENNEGKASSWKNVAKSDCDFEKIMPGVSFTYSQSTVPSINISLNEGYNALKIKLYGANGENLTYTMSIYREEAPDDAVFVSGEGSNVQQVGESVVSDPDGIDRVEEEVYVSYGLDDERRICFMFNAFWNMIYDGKTYYGNSCIDFFFLTEQCSNSDMKVVTLIDDKGHKKNIKIYDGSCEKNKNRKEVVNDNDADSGNDNEENEGGSEILKEIIPEEFSNLLAYDILASQKLTIADRAILNGSLYGCSTVNVGANASVSGLLNVLNDAEFRSNSVVESATVGGQVNEQHGAKIGTLQKQSFILPDMARLTVRYGSDDLIVKNNEHVTVHPGDYRQLHIYSGAKVQFESGVYNIESFIVEPDVELYFENASEPISMFVQKDFSIGDRVEMVSYGDWQKLLMYTNSTNIYMGVSSTTASVLIAPDAAVNIASRYSMNGKVWAREITIQPDAVVK